MSPDGRRVVATSGLKTLLWDAATGTELIVLRHNDADYVNAVGFSPDGLRVITASNGGTAKI